MPYDDADSVPFMIEQDSIVFKIERDTPIELERLTYGMMAFGAEYERHFRKTHPQSEPQEADLLVQRITEKCIWIEMIGAAAPILQGMDNYLIFKDFLKHLSIKIGALKLPGGRAENATPKELDAIQKIAETLAGDPNGHADMLAIEFKEKTQEKKTSFKLAFKAKEAEQVVENARAQIAEITGEEPNRHNGVLMRLYQTTVGDVQADSSTGEKGTIESITDVPRRLIYASELAGQKIKSAWDAEGQSPYELAFVVDVDVQTVNGKPRAYRIMDVHDIFPIESEDDDT